MEHKIKWLSPAEDFSGRNDKLFLSFNNMVENFNYPILKVNRSETQFGERVQIELYDYIVFAPKSYNNNITDDEIKEYSNGHYYLKKVMNTNGYYDLEFEKVKFVSGYKKILRIADMLDHISYQIFEMQRKHTIYGKTIMVDTLENKIFLPKRFNGITDETINEVNSGNYCIKKIPVNSTGFSRLEIQTVPINVHQHDVSLPETEKSEDTQLTQKRTIECQEKINEESTAWIRVTNEQLSYDLNIEMEQDIEGSNKITMETPIENQNESYINNSISEEYVDLNLVLKKETNTKAPDDYSPIKNLDSCFDKNKIEKYLCYFDNNTILLSDDEEEDEIDDDDDVSASTTEPGAMASPSNDTNEVQPKIITKIKCLLCPRKHVTKTEKTMLKHMRKFHSLDNINYSQKIICDQKKVSCKYCEFKYNRGYINQHMRKKHPTDFVARGRAASKVHAATGSPTNRRPFINFSPCSPMPPMPDFLQHMPVTRAEHEAICYHLYMRRLQSNAALDETSALSSPDTNFYENGTEVETYGTLVPQECKMEL